MDYSRETMPVLTLALAGCLLLLLAAVRRKIAGTTLVSAWAWGLAVVSVLASVAAYALLASEPVKPSAGSFETWSTPLGFAASMIALCPPVALLGAKRPQNKPWQLIVLSLWGILALPGFESALRGGGEMVDIHPARGAFLLTLIVMGTFNHLPTRFWPCSLLFAAGQLALLYRWLRLPAWDGVASLNNTGPAIAMSCWIAAALIGLISSRRLCSKPGLDRVWVDFRNAFGAIWALRMAERMNTAAVSYAWHVRLTWEGFRTLDGDVVIGWSETEQRQVQSVFANLLRRFVSSDWIERRLN